MPCSCTGMRRRSSQLQLKSSSCVSPSGPVVIWLQLQITPLYTDVKTVQQPVSNLAESNLRGFLKHQLASGFRGIYQLIRYWSYLVWPKDFLSDLGESSG